MQMAGERVQPLAGIRFGVVGQSPIATYGGRLLALLGAEVVALPSDRAAGGPPSDFDAVIDASGHGVPDASCPVITAPPPRSPAEAWAASGAMGLTGRKGESPGMAPGDVGNGMHGAALAFGVLAACRGFDVDLDGPALLGERAAVLGLGRRTGDESVSGSSYLIPAAEGWFALSLKRADDDALLGALLERDGPVDLHDARRWAASRPASGVVRRAQLLGLPASVVGPPSEGDDQLRARQQWWPPAPWLIDGAAPGRGRRAAGAISTSPRLSSVIARHRVTVVDLSALWAGPLATSLLLLAGCRVIKVEDPRRPDTTRLGPPTFFDLLNGGKESVAVPFVRGGALADLVAGADVVVDSSRPRAMEQLEIGPAPGQLWVSITGYGRTGPNRQWAALGDDAAAAAGFVAHGGPDASPMFCGDAAADPITGLHAAVATLAAVAGGFTGTIDLAMREVVGHAMGPSAFTPSRSPIGVDEGRHLHAAPPRARRPVARGPELGQDNRALLRG